MKFGVREITNVIMKAKSAIKLGNKVYYKDEPVLYFDSLKTSSLEGAATSVYATGGRGNSRLIAWEGERTLTFNMEDALLSPESFAVLSGAGLVEINKGEQETVKAESDGYSTWDVYRWENEDVIEGTRIVKISTDSISYKIDKKFLNGKITKIENLALALNREEFYNYISRTNNSQPQYQAWVDFVQNATDEQWQDYIDALFSLDDTGAYWYVLSGDKTLNTAETACSDAIILQDCNINQNIVDNGLDIFIGYDFDSQVIDNQAASSLQSTLMLHEDEWPPLHLRVTVEPTNITGYEHIVEHTEITTTRVDETDVYYGYTISKPSIGNVYLKSKKNFLKNQRWEYPDDEVNEEKNRSALVNRWGDDTPWGDPFAGPAIADYYTPIYNKTVKQLTIDPDQFGTNFYLEANTLFRDTNGFDHPATFIIPNCKVQSNFTMTMASSGDPSTFNFVLDAFPGYTRFDSKKKVLAALQIEDDPNIEE